MKNLFLSAIALLIFSYSGFCQIAYAKEFSKDMALFRAKQFVIDSIIGSSTEVVKFEIDPLAASNSGELTSLVYQCEQKNKEGLILGFYGDRWNNAGVTYKMYAFKNFPKSQALDLLNKIQENMKEYSKYLNSDADNNNIYFEIDDLKFLIYNKGMDTKIRVFWNDFDSEWDVTAFKRSKKRLEHKLD